MRLAPRTSTVLALSIAIVAAFAGSARADKPSWVEKKIPPGHQTGTGSGTGTSGTGTTTGEPDLNDLGNVRVGSGDVVYRWERNGIAFDFQNRDGRWSRTEAAAVGHSLDRLPDLYLRKAVSGGCRKLYRDGAVPRAPFDFMVSHKDDIAAYAVPAWPYRYVTFGDKTFTFGFTNCYAIVTHELGHCAHNDQRFSNDLEWLRFSWTLVRGGLLDAGLKSWNGFPSDYARTNYREDFAEAAMYYWCAPDELARANSAKFAYMRDRVFEGLSSPAEHRLGLTAVAPVRPVLASVGNGSGRSSTVKTVRGGYFMGAFDGGFNTVRFRGKSAIQTPISRQTLYVLVPVVDPGAAPVTVQTQDGTSDPRTFNVEKAWWRFW